MRNVLSLFVFYLPSLDNVSSNAYSSDDSLLVDGETLLKQFKAVFLLIHLSLSIKISLQISYLCLNTILSNIKNEKKSVYAKISRWQYINCKGNYRVN